MKNTAIKTTYIGLTFAFVISALGVVQAQAQTNSSQKTETVNGKIYIIHKIQPQETYYQLSRIYDVPVNDIMTANNKKNLRVGDTARIPSKTQPVQKLEEVGPTHTEAINNTTKPENALDVFTEYKVGANETLYSIAQRFRTSIDDIKTMNNLKSDLVREGQFLKIPDGELPKPEPIRPTPPPIVITQAEPEESKDLTARDFNSNKFGIRETSEKGIGVWMENLETKNNSNLALHKTAPVGTVLKITNPITKSVTYAKVVGKFADNTDTHSAIVVLSKSAAAYIGAVDKRFIVEITYGLPLE